MPTCPEKASPMGMSGRPKQERTWPRMGSDIQVPGSILPSESQALGVWVSWAQEVIL